MTVIQFPTAPNNLHDRFLALLGLTLDQALALSEYEKDALQDDFNAWVKTQN
jgi:hypothetical protein